MRVIVMTRPTLASVYQQPSNASPPWAPSPRVRATQTLISAALMRCVQKQLVDDHTNAQTGSSYTAPPRPWLRLKQALFPLWLFCNKTACHEQRPLTFSLYFHITRSLFLATHFLKLKSTSFDVEDDEQTAIDILLDTSSSDPAMHVCPVCFHPHVSNLKQHAPPFSHVAMTPTPSFASSVSSYSAKKFTPMAPPWFLSTNGHSPHPGESGLNGPMDDIRQQKMFQLVRDMI